MTTPSEDNGKTLVEQRGRRWGLASQKRGQTVYSQMVSTIETKRLLIRPAVERDRLRFVELLTDPEFTVFSGSHDIESANTRFEQMLSLADAVPFAKQPVIDRETGTIIGYTGVGTVMLDGLDRLEWGWRITSEARGQGYATEATTALLAAADQQDNGEVLCIIATDNYPSRSVADKAGFRWWRQFNWPEDSATYDLLLRRVGAGGPPLQAPPGLPHL